MLNKAIVCVLIPFSLACADFEYQSTSRVTGGSLIQIMRFVPGGGREVVEACIGEVAAQRLGERHRIGREILVHRGLL